MILNEVEELFVMSYDFDTDFSTLLRESWKSVIIPCCECFTFFDDKCSDSSTSSYFWEIYYETKE